MSGGDAGLAVPKDRLAVTIHLDTNAAIEGEIYMESTVGDLSVHQKMTRFLEQGSRFFPVRTSASTEFINKTATRYIEVGIPHDPGANFFSHLLMQTVPVMVYFKNDSAMSGQLMAEVPQDRGRLSDCVNVDSFFLSVYTNGKMCYINKDTVMKIVHADNL
jgi:hypothetical protein